MSVVFLTGFPGFLGSELTPRVLGTREIDHVVCLVQSKFISQARARLEQIEASHPDCRGRIRLVTGDITRPNLDLDDLDGLCRQVSEIFHLAAVYDLGTARESAVRINVQGTQEIIRFANACPQLRRLQYVSTCYVSGRFQGVFSESDLEKGQTFNNYYEETKYLAELEVQAALRGGLPVTVYRPAIVVGDSLSGATQKYDGPYYIIRWLLRQPPMAFLPIVGNPDATRVNLVPRDFIVNAITYLSGLEQSRNKVYQLADPAALTVKELIAVLGHATQRTIVRVPLPLGLAKFAIRRVPGVHWLLQIPAPAVDYFVHPTEYACDNVLKDLAGSGLKVPPLPTYIDRLVRFVRANPSIPSGPMV